MSTPRITLTLTLVLLASVLAVSQATPDATGTGTTNYITRWVSATAQGNSLLYQSSTGRIGLGTTAPTTTFDVANGNALFRGIGGFKSSGNSGSVFVGDAGHGMTAYRGGGLVVHGGTSLSAYQVPNGLFLQDTTGNVGIGTTTPHSQLHVNGDGQMSRLVLSDENGGCYVYYSYNGNLYSYNTSC